LDRERQLMDLKLRPSGGPVTPNALGGVTMSPSGELPKCVNDLLPV
jgi:hypothetical protein